ncbi:cytochrome P450 monooxygenase CYP63 [Sistotremastrum niveocremeum HHB9708]|uniref:Cytochrome P450 monooxygenase CYP63 n=1 Tax=Sistotremastrum niveocremeum HHB9708 TaxID=1314777 RepID=A0A164WRC7_9AGAM|nr:cytochrome P450 monooxygenase CYP63 [Sistotremastrum niveocremeum HHB9708]
MSLSMDEGVDYTAYRRFFLFKTVIPAFVFPTVTVAFLARLLFHNTLSWPATILLQIASVPLWNTIRSTYSDFRHTQEAKRLGAVEPPKVVGKWPGNIDIMLAMFKSAKTKYFHDYIDTLFEEHSSHTVNTRLLWGNQIWTRDEGVVKYVLATGFEKFGKGQRIKMNMETFLGSGIFNRDGDTWRSHRAMARPFFAKERISDFEYFEEHAAHTLSVLRGVGDSAVDVQDLFARFTLDTASSFLFGSNIDTLSLPLPKAGEAVMGPKGSAIEGEFGEFASAFESAQQVIIERSRFGVAWPVVELFGDRTLQYVQAIRNFLDPMVKRALDEKQKAKAAGIEKHAEDTNFLDYLATNTDDPEMIRFELLNILLASRDTTACLLTYTIYLLAQYPEVLARVREEALNACPPGQVPTYESLRHLKYMRAVLNETLRLFPPVPGNGRASVGVASAIPPSPASPDQRPIYVPPYTGVIYSPLLLHRRKDLWGPDADEFDPDRWIDKRVDRMVKNPLMFVPFNAGPRICLGQQFALNEASFFLVRLFQEYDRFELTPEYQPAGSIPPDSWKTEGRGRAKIEKVWPASALTLYVKGGLWVRFGRAAA